MDDKVEFGQRVAVAMTAEEFQRWMDRLEQLGWQTTFDDHCDCPACAPPCESKGKKCFIPCAKCQKPEEDEAGELKSVSRRTNYRLEPADERSDERLVPLKGWDF